MLHLGGGFITPTKSVVLILDYKKAVENPDTSLFLKNYGHANQIYITSEKVRSIVFSEIRGEVTIYYSPISSVTLQKRGNASFLRKRDFYALERSLPNGNQ